jgi:ribosome-binding protein aMBF1 (putative translation factor)
MTKKATATRPARKAKAQDGVMIPRRRYQALLRELADLRDARDLRAAEAAADPKNALPVALVERMVAGEHPVRIWRKHRGLTLTALAERSGVDPTYISQIETRKKPGSVKALKALATTLGVELDDVVP